MTNFDKPKFITFEGGEGSGKSTQSKMLYEFLLSKQIKAIHTREVGGTIEAEKIRELLVYSELLPMSELLLVMAARYEHLSKVIVPALIDGFWVICDRFVDSTACYQSGESGLTIEDIFELHHNLMGVGRENEYYGSKAMLPDLTFFMDIPPEMGLERVAIRGDANKFEAKNMAFHRNIYQRFKSISASQADRVVSINCANKTADDVHKIVVDKIFMN
jgi:dTMP kinase